MTRFLDDYRSPVAPITLAPCPEDPNRSPVVLLERLEIFSFELTTDGALLPGLVPGPLPGAIPDSLLNAHLWIYGELRDPQLVAVAVDELHDGRHRRSSATPHIYELWGRPPATRSSTQLPMSAEEETMVLRAWGQMGLERRRASWIYRREVRERRTPEGLLRLFETNDVEGDAHRELIQVIGTESIDIPIDDEALLLTFATTTPRIILDDSEEVA